MKVQRSIRKTLLLSLLLPTLSLAAPAYMKLGDIKGECAATEQALLGLRTSQPEPVALLLPAVQKVREASNRMHASCDASRDVNACSARNLSSLILASDDGANPALSLLDLYAKGNAMNSRQAAQSLRKAGSEGGAEATDAMLRALVKGLVANMSAARMPASVTAPMNRLISPASE